MECGWGKNIRAAVVTRRDHKREPTEAEMFDEANQFNNVTVEEIIDGFNSGKEVGLNILIYCINSKLIADKSLAMLACSD